MRAAKWMWVFVAVACAVFFQNCSSKIPGLNWPFHSNSASSLASGSSGGGSGYDGMTYAHATMSGLCPDGSFIDSKIRFQTDGSAQLTRDNCSNLTTPKPINASRDITFDPLNYSYIVYNGLRYVNGIESIAAIDHDAIGNVYIAGALRKIGQDSNYAFVAKMKPDGTLIWAKKVKDGWEKQSSFTSLHVDPATGNMLVAGAAAGPDSFGRTAIMMTLSTDGAIMNSFFYSGIMTLTAVKSPFIQDFTLTQNGLFIAGGFFHDPNDQNLDRFVAKIDPASGHLVWQKGDTIPAPTPNPNNPNPYPDPGFKRILSGMNGEVYLTGQLVLPDGLAFNPFATLLKLNADGSSAFTLQYGTEVGAFALAANGDILYGGQMALGHRPTSFLSRVSTVDGSLINSLGFASPSEAAGLLTGVQEAPDGSYYATGVEIKLLNANSNPPLIQATGAVRKVNSDGTLAWALRYSRTANDVFMVPSMLTHQSRLWFPVVTDALDGSGDMTSLLWTLDISLPAPACANECKIITDESVQATGVTPNPIPLMVTDPHPPNMPGFNGLIGPIPGTVEMEDVQMMPVVQ